MAPWSIYSSVFGSLSWSNKKQIYTFCKLAILVWSTEILKAIWKFVFQGCDIEKDDIVLISGQRIGASEIGLLATVGATVVKVLKIFTFVLKIVIES